MKGFLDALHNTTKAIDGLPETLAPFGLQCVRDNMKSGTFKANAPLTKNTKNAGAKPLFDTGETYASLTYQAGKDEYRVGTNKAHAPLINDGGVIKAKKAKQLAIPVNKQVKKRTEVYGVRKTLEGLERQGWKIFYRPHSIMGRAPLGAKAFGQRVKTKANRNNKGADKGVFYVLYIRTPQVKVSSREFMYLSPEQQQAQREMALEHLKAAIQ
ncbi:hypothetical protein VOA_001660 [Vibrio sp. RC586]|uniref:hypothetical protein n=1 Tax=Vibrio sp. RC586 TaxID=675815 RepID=UPI0001BB7BC2|nr:hypothetical protein [Vibrio sp. RC586]EEY99311.1 hypothetical protein VOA_001660 [Vibrio sp. RC586]